MDGDTAGWNYVSFRDDNIRVDHKWVDGERRYSVEAANVTAAKTEAQRVLDRIGGTELGNAVNADFRGEGQSTIIGRTAGDLAAAAQIYRNPCFETFRYFFTKGDKVVWQTAVTARMPGLSPVAVYADGNINRTLVEINRMAAAL